MAERWNGTVSGEGVMGVPRKAIAGGRDGGLQWRKRKSVRTKG